MSTKEAHARSGEPRNRDGQPGFSPNTRDEEGGLVGRDPRRFYGYRQRGKIDSVGV